MIKKNKASRIFIVVFPVLFFISVRAYTQVDYAWWNAKHQWDGSTHWSAYINLSPRFLGPNALPVPENQGVGVCDYPQLKFAANAFFMKGDKTFSNDLHLSVPLKNVVQIDLWSVTAEYFENDTLTRDERAVRFKDSKGIAFGDIYFATKVILFKQNEIRPDLSFRFAFKTASGSGLEYARYTDTPGYFFDVTAGKSFDLKSIEDRLKVFAMAGFYAYQTYDILHPQNDAFLFGLGCEYKLKPEVRLITDLSGYYGYFNNGDRPIVLRSKLMFPFRKLDGFIGATYGLHDFEYLGFSFGIIYNLAGVFKHAN